MTTDVFPDVSTPYGRRVHDRLRDERVIWLITAAPSGTPQPNPVWFVRVGDDIVIYNDNQSDRLAWLRDRPRVALHLNANDRGGDVVVLTGRAEIFDDGPLPQDQPEYLDKYRDDMERVSGSLEAFGERYSVGMRVRVTKVRGF
ncbi:TIGR03667 family PPOX class F420-dependent oxidoreductase [Jiangella asiatica]|uniref:TIGR03667 family PPOX class F420-dependent oxidoreductase n=1 Tax=Jiangella asiatica TaxID=2530372 RepID=A0A4R5DGS7_9ACTN|nr:TIGR03667 family PPOX class F420-dependent oxidoreductase [Jiangella asiatica]TDE09643.1 TIGR03667 family PPOX class F420-dependent oxidoreductase [Jiangella asiatica]